MEKASKNTSSFECKLCNFKCCKKSDYNRHISTNKHNNRINLNNKSFECKTCQKQYTARNSLWYHEKNCSSVCIEPTIITEKEDNEEQLYSNIKNIVVDLMNQNQTILMENNEFKKLILEQNKQMMEMIKDSKIINNSITTNNNKFNLNVFLNETCKDAMNIMDFANSLEIKMTELEDVGTLGYATGISNIIIRGLNELEIHQRPIHCSDLKRESIHVKDKNIWALDKDKTLMQTAIKRVARKNILKVQDWKQANPEYSELNSKTMDKYSKILIEATGCFEPHEKEREYGKIVRAIAKEVVIDK